jgi:hypothetical protein
MLTCENRIVIVIDRSVRVPGAGGSSVIFPAYSRC